MVAALEVGGGPLLLMVTVARQNAAPIDRDRIPPIEMIPIERLYRDGLQRPRRERQERAQRAEPIAQPIGVRSDVRVLGAIRRLGRSGTDV